MSLRAVRAKLPLVASRICRSSKLPDYQRCGQTKRINWTSDLTTFKPRSTCVQQLGRYEHKGVVMT